MRTRILSSLLVGGICVLMATGQTPPAATPKKIEQPKPLTLEEVTAAAMQHHPDVRVATAEAELAQAKLQQTKNAVAMKVAAAKRAVESLKSQVRAELLVYEKAEITKQKIQEQIALIKKIGADIAQSEWLQLETTAARYETTLAEAQKTLAKLKGELANVEAEYAAFIGGNRVTQTSEVIWFDDKETRATTRTWYYRKLQPASGSFAEQLRSALDKPIKLEAQKAVHLEEILATLLKAANVTGTVRVPLIERPSAQLPIKIDLAAGEHSLGSWLQLVVDESNIQIPRHYDLFLRQYGLLLTDAKNPPSDAIGVNEYWKQVRAEKPARE